jgi:hypothetical protein
MFGSPACLDDSRQRFALSYHVSYPFNASEMFALQEKTLLAVACDPNHGMKAALPLVDPGLPSNSCATFSFLTPL